MKANEIKVGGYYVAKVGLNITTVRVDSINDRAGSDYHRGHTSYIVTNVKTNRQTTFRSAAKFRRATVNPNTTPKPGYNADGSKGLLAIDAIKRGEKFIGGSVMTAQPKPLTPPVAPIVPEPPTTLDDLECDCERTEALPGERCDECGGIVEGEQRSDPTTGTGSTTAPIAVVGTSTVPVNIPVFSPLGISGLAAQIAKQNAADTNAPHVQLKALAGTGKTTSCIQGLIEVKGGTPSIQPSPQQRAFWDALALGKSDTVRLSAFNATITDEMKARVNAAGLDRKGCEARGVHSLGLQAVTKAFGRMEASQWTVLDVIAETLGGDFRELKTKPGMMVMMSATDSLVSLCKQNLMEPSIENLEQLAGHYDVDTDGKMSKIADIVPQVLERSKRPEGRIAFDDMVWLPLVLDMPIPKVDVQVIDEVQDLNRMQQELMYKAGHRIIMVGDENQAIMGFAGADAVSMSRMSETLGRTARGCTTMPLTVTRRCGKAIVNEARKIVPTFEAHESNSQGLVDEARYPIQGEKENRRELPWDETYCKLVRDGAMILCRVNAPLVSQCFRFLKRKIKANIIGRNIGEGLVTLIEKSKATNVDQLRGWMEEWLLKEQASEAKKKFASEARMIALQDRHDCVMCFADGETYTNAVVQKIKSVFTDSKDSSGIRLSSIHRSKGLEADQVFFLQPKGGECPHPMARSAWQREQEENLRYVAITRAINELYYVY